MTLPNRKHQSKIIKAISRSTLPVNLGLLGGEPTMYPNFIELLREIHEKCGWNDTYNTHNNIYVVSNGSKPLEWFKKHPYFENMSYLWSFHPEEADVETMMANVIEMRDKGFKTKVNIILHPRKKYWEKATDMYTRCKEERIKTHPHFLYQENANTLWRYKEDFWKWAEKWFCNEPREIEFHELIKDIVQTKSYNDYEVYFNQINKFQGFKCMNSNYEINVNGRTVMFCIENEGTDLTNSPDFFKNISSVDPITCPHTRCNCDGLLKIMKYKEGYEFTKK